jgi:transposase
MDGMRASSVLQYGLGILKRSGIPRYTNKYSRKDFTTHQHLSLCVLKEYDKCPWRRLISNLQDSETICNVLELEKIPHYTTPEKFLLRVPTRWFNYILHIITNYVLSMLYVAVDGTGFKPNNASSHYEMRIGRKGERKDYLKPIIGYDTETQLVLKVKVVRGNRNECPQMKSVLAHLGGVKRVCADKGYDSERNQELVRELGAESFIDVRGVPRRGRYRKKTHRLKVENPDIWKSNYHQRNIAETGNSVIKRMFGEYVPGKGIMAQKKYLMTKFLAYDFYVLCRDKLVVVLLLVRVSTRPDHLNLYFYVVYPLWILFMYLQNIFFSKYPAL